MFSHIVAKNRDSKCHQSIRQAKNYVTISANTSWRTIEDVHKSYLLITLSLCQKAAISSLIENIIILMTALYSILVYSKRKITRKEHYVFNMI